ncbi:MAG: hypothetical protein ACJAUH_002632, partial [Saprospiraceae bacterium]
MNYKLFDRFDIGFIPRQNGQIICSPLFAIQMNYFSIIASSIIGSPSP